MITFVLRFRFALALALLIAFASQAAALPLNVTAQSASVNTTQMAFQKSDSQSIRLPLPKARLRSTETFSLASALESRAIPESAKRQVRAQLAERTTTANTATATPPAGQSCADSTYNNILIVYGGISCSVSEPSGATFGSCTWMNMSSSAMNAVITPVTAPAGTNSILTFSTPSNPTLTSASYTVQLSCGISAVTYNITVLPNPEIPGPAANSPGVGGGGPPPCATCGPTFIGKPVEITDGELWRSDTDVRFSGPFGLSFTRTYASGTIGTSDLGAHWQHNYDARLDLSQASNGSIGFYDESGFPHYFNAVTAGTSSYDPINGLTLALNSAGTAYTVTTFGSLVRTFNSLGLLTSLHDRVGNTQTITRDTTSGHNNRIVSVADPLGRQLCFFSDSQNRVTAVSYLASGTCPTTVPTSGTVVKMTYDSGTSCTTGDLCSTTEPDGKAWTYQYATTSVNTSFVTDLTEVDDPVGDPEEINTYNGFQVVQQVTGKCSTVPCADTGGDLTYTYPTDLSGNVTIVDGENRSTALVFDPNAWMLTSISGPVCKCGGDQTRKYSYDSSDRILTKTDDGLDGSTAHTITFSYSRDSGTTTYPGPTKAVENLDTSGTTRTTSYQYYAIGDPRQDLPEIITLPSVDKSGSTITLSDTYSTTGLLTQRTRTGYVNGTSTSYAWKWTYDTRGRLLTAVGPRTDLTQTTTYKYFSDTDSDHQRAGQLQTITDALSHVTTLSAETGFTSYDPFGDPESITDANSVVTEITYDARGRKLTSTLLGVTGDTTNLITTWTYDAAGRLTKRELPKDNAVILSYDTSDRVKTEVRVDSGGLQQEQLAFVYNANDQMTTRSAEKCTTPAATCSAWTTTWTASYAYSPTTSDLATITNPDSTTIAFTYVDSGPIATVNDENHATGTNYTDGYDVAGRRLTETRKLGTGTVVTKYAYDLHDNVETVTDPNSNTTTYHYDDFDRVTKETSPVQGVTTYAHDPANDLITLLDANSATTTYTYDALNRPLTESATKSSTTLSSSWTYDDSTSGHFGIGHLATMTDPSGSSGYTYERRGNIAVENRSIVGNSFTQGYTYDANGNRATMTYPDGYVVTTGFDFADRPSSSVNSSTLTTTQLAALTASGLGAPTHTAQPEVRGTTHSSAVQSLPQRVGVRPNRKSTGAPEPSSNKLLTTHKVQPFATSSASFVSNATYMAFGPINVITFGNGTTQTLSWSTRYFPTENKLAGSSTLADYSYGEDGVGNIKTLTDKINSGYDRTFGYDDLNRLTTANSGTSLWGTATGNGYTYDSMGNIKSLELGTTRTDTFTYSGMLPKISTVDENGSNRTLAYDSYGNETGDGKSTFTYSPRELTASDSRFVSAYYYDGFRRRLSTTLSSGGDSRDSFFDPGSHLIAETTQFTGSNPPLAYKYIWLGNRPVAQVDSGGTHWTFADHLGTPLVQTNTTPAITWQAEYEPFGNIWTVRTGSTLHQPLRFPGQISEQFDSGNNGLTERSYNNARWYRPSWGSYTQADPMHLVPGLSNLYEYALDGPDAYIDPSGKQSQPGAPFPPFCGFNGCEPPYGPSDPSGIGVGGGISVGGMGGLLGGNATGMGVFSGDGSFCFVYSFCMRAGLGFFIGGGAQFSAGPSPSRSDGECENNHGFGGDIADGIGGGFKAKGSPDGGAGVGGDGGLTVAPGGKLGPGVGADIGIDFCYSCVRCPKKPCKRNPY